MKFLLALGLLLALGIVGLNLADGAGECGDPNMEAMKLIPCAEAAKDEKASVSSGCCLQIKKLGQNPKCLCAAMLSDTAKNAGSKPEVAITIPKRCNLANRPIGYKCGRKCSSLPPSFPVP